MPDGSNFSLKRLLLGKPIPSSMAHHERLSRVTGLAVLSSDALSSVVPFNFLEEEVIHTATSPSGQRHHWLWLTKRPERMAKFSNYLKARDFSKVGAVHQGLKQTNCRDSMGFRADNRAEPASRCL